MSVAVATMPGILNVMDRTGDTKVEWDRDKPEEVNAAREMFKKMKALGYLAYTITRKGDKGAVIKDFDPAAEQIVMAPQTVGG